MYMVIALILLALVIGAVLWVKQGFHTDNVLPFIEVSAISILLIFVMVGTDPGLHQTVNEWIKKHCVLLMSLAGIAIVLVIVLSSIIRLVLRFSAAHTKKADMPPICGGIVVRKRHSEAQAVLNRLNFSRDSANEYLADLEFKEISPRYIITIEGKDKQGKDRQVDIRLSRRNYYRFKVGDYFGIPEQPPKETHEYQFDFRRI